MTAWLLLGGMWACLFGLIALSIERLVTWYRHQQEWGSVYRHHDAMGALDAEVRHG